MSDHLRIQIYNSLVLKKTEDLLEIWQDKDLAEWDEETFEILREILLRRLGYVPSHLTQIHNNLAIKKTEDLFEIWEDENLAESDKETFEVVREILLGRLGYVPSHAVRKQIQKALMDIDEFLEKGELDRALKECNLAIQLQPDLAIAYNYRGEIHDEREQLEDAIVDYQKAVQFDPELRIAWENLQSIDPLLEGKFQESATKHHLDRALEYAYEDEPEKALNECEIARSNMPNIAVAYNYLGLILETLNELEPAIDSYLKAIQLNPRFYAARENIANARVKLEEELYHLVAIESQNTIFETSEAAAEYEGSEDSEILEDENPVPAWVYLNEKSLLLMGWPGYRNRPGRSGYDPLERNAEYGHMQMRVLRLLATQKFRTCNPIYLAVMTCMGILYCSPLIAILLISLRDWSSISLAIFYVPHAALGALLLMNVFLSLQLGLNGEDEDNGYTFF